MNKKDFSAAVKKHAAAAKEMTQDEFTTYLNDGDDLLSNEDVNQLIAHFFPAEAPAPPPAADYDPKNPNASVDLSDYDYKNLTDGSFKAYQELVDTLQLDRHYDFQLMKVRPVKRIRYEGVPGSPVDLVGITIKNDEPENVTRIPVRAAKDYNAQIHGDHAKTNGKFYLLKK